MKQFVVLTLFCLLLGSVPAAFAGDVAVSKMSLMTFNADVQINAPAAKVWTALTDKDKAMSWCPMWKNAKDAMSLTKVGNTMDFVDDWKNPGKTVVLYVSPDKELRLAHVPNDGSYVCQMKIILTPAGNATNVKVTEQYSDAPDATIDNDAATKTKAEMAQYLGVLKSVAEKM